MIRVLKSTDAKTLRITEIFKSIQGEARTVGVPTVFVRLTGCPLRCQYCDTAYAFSGGTIRSIDEIIESVLSYKTDYVTITGGEPLAQQECPELLTRLADLRLKVSLETSGAISIANIDPRISRVIDVKTPGSGEVLRNLTGNYHLLTPHDQVKFVICHRDDFEWSVKYIDEHSLEQTGCELLFSPSFSELHAGTLADWILAEHIPVRLQLQVHKLLWGDVPGR